MSEKVYCYYFTSFRKAKSLGGLIVSMLAIAPKVRGFKPDRGDGFLRETKIRSTTSFGEEVKASAPCRKILRRAKKSLRSMNKNISNAKFYSFFRQYPPDLLLDVYDCGISYRAVVDESIVIPCRYHSAIILLADISPGG
jgi:hypothetical protein